MRGQRPAIPARHWVKLSTDSLPLSKEDEHGLIALAQQGNRQAQDKLIQHNERFLVLKARQAITKHGGDIDDYMQLGRMALFKAMTKYDLSRNLRLITYAVHWIRAYFNDYVISNISLVKFGTSSANIATYYAISKACAILAMEGKNPDDLDAIAGKLGRQRKDIEEIYIRLKGDHWLDSPIAEESSTTLLDTLSETQANESHNALEFMLDQEANAGLVRRVDTLLNAMDERDRAIVEDRLMEEGIDRTTLEDLALEFGVTKGRISQLETALGAKLRKLLHARKP